MESYNLRRGWLLADSEVVVKLLIIAGIPVLVGSELSISMNGICSAIHVAGSCCTMKPCPDPDSVGCCSFVFLGATRYSAADRLRICWRDFRRATL